MSQRPSPDPGVPSLAAPSDGLPGESNVVPIPCGAPSRRGARESDAGLVERVARKDRGALAELYRRHSRTVYSLAYNTMRNRESAEDLVQDVFLEVWSTAANYRSERGGALTWILAITRNRGVDQLRRFSARRRAQEKIGRGVLVSQPDETFDLTWENLRRRQVGEVLQALPPEQLRVLALAYSSGLTHREIARQFRLPLGTVKGRMRLALKKLREQLEDWEALADRPEASRPRAEDGSQRFCRRLRGVEGE